MVLPFGACAAVVVLLMERSAVAMTTGPDAPLELVETGSESLVETATPLATEPDALGAMVVTSVKVAVAPLASGPPRQVIVPVAPTAGVVQVNDAAGVIDWNTSE